MKITERDIFMCYSFALRDYLRTVGIKYLVSGRDFRTGLPFYAYYKNDELMDVIHNWKEISANLGVKDPRTGAVPDRQE